MPVWSAIVASRIMKDLGPLVLSLGVEVIAQIRRLTFSAFVWINIGTIGSVSLLLSSCEWVKFPLSSRWRVEPPDLSLRKIGFASSDTLTLFSFGFLSSVKWPESRSIISFKPTSCFGSSRMVLLSSGPRVLTCSGKGPRRTIASTQAGLVAATRAASSLL